jgi:hypothetical protein
MGWEYAKARLGRIEGNDLYVDGRTVRLLPYLQSGEVVDTISRWLGAGPVYLNVLARERTHLGLVGATAEGGAYAVDKVSPGGRRTFTGMRAITSGLAPIPAGVLAHVPADKIWVPQITITGRPPADVKAIAAVVAGDLNRHQMAWAPANVTSMVVIPRLRGLDDDELMEVFYELNRLGKLGHLFNLVRSTQFRSFLRDRGVPWTYVFANWEPSVQDNAAMFAGVLVGGAENIYDALELAAVLMGAAFSEELASRARPFWEAVVRFIQHPLMTINEMTGMPRALYNAFIDKMLHLEFFEAGRMLGNLLVMLLTLPKAIAAVPKLAANAARLALTFTRVSLEVIEKLGVRLIELVPAALAELVPEVSVTPGVTSTGHLLTVDGPNLMMTAKNQPTVAISRVEILRAAKRRGVHFKGLTEAELDRALKSLGEQPPETRPRQPARVPGLSVRILERLVKEAMRNVRASLGKTWVNNTKFGDKLHTELSRLINERVPGARAGVTIAVEQKMSTFGHIPPKVLDMTVEEFVTQTFEVRPYAEQLKPLFTGDNRAARLVRNLEPDLVIRTQGELVVWDLTSRLNQQHLAKTLLYSAVLRQGDQIVRIGEAYWMHIGKATEAIKDIYPAALHSAAAQHEAAEAQRAAARRAKH